MKKNHKNLIKIGFIAWIVAIIFSNYLLSSSLGWKNTSYNPKYAETPYEPKYYNFVEQTGETYCQSHYSTHDWIADAALRILYEENSDDWDWIIDSNTIDDENPQWPQNDEYGDSNKKHYPVRSYISFLFSTQMPDMNRDNVNNDPPKRQPMEINLKYYEGEIIGNDQHGTEKWVGNTDWQNYHWEMVEGNPTPEIDTKKPARAHLCAYRMGRAAVDSLCHTENENGQKTNWAKVEAAACWLGVMSHYIADVSCPPHLLPAIGYIIQDGERIEVQHYESGYHTWFEYQTGQKTLWDSIYSGPEGYIDDTKFFNIDPMEIEALRPDLSTIEAAQKGIEISYGHIDGEGFEDFDRKGLYIDDDIKHVRQDWSWGDTGRERNTNEIIVGDDGLTYRDYYDKVNDLLENAVYYTAAAMKWVNEEVKRKNGGLGGDPAETLPINPDKWATHPYLTIYDEVEVPDINDPLENEIKDSYKDSEFEFETVGIMMAIFAPIMTLVFLPKIIKTIKKEKLEEYITN